MGRHVSARPRKTIVIWARSRSITRDEMYSLVYHGLRDRYLTQVRSGNLILIALSVPYTTPVWFKPSPTKTKGSFGRGNHPTTDSDHTASTAPDPPAPGRGFAPGRGKADAQAGASRAPKSTRSSRAAKPTPPADAVVPKPPPAPDP